MHLMGYDPYFAKGKSKVAILFYTDLAVCVCNCLNSLSLSLRIYKYIVTYGSILYHTFLLILWAPFSEMVTSYARHLEKKHDMLLEMLFEHGTYNKLYSYQHLINGFAVHISPEQVKTWITLILGLISL